MPRHLNRQRSPDTVRGALQCLADASAERKRVKDWASQPRRIQRRRGMSETTKTRLYAAGALVLMAGIGVMLAWRG